MLRVFEARLSSTEPPVEPFDGIPVGTPFDFGIIRKPVVADSARSAPDPISVSAPGLSSRIPEAVVLMTNPVFEDAIVFDALPVPGV
jgi:hypothetical protein